MEDTTVEDQRISLAGVIIKKNNNKNENNMDVRFSSFKKQVDTNHLLSENKCNFY